MISGNWILSALLIVPVVGVLAIMTLRGDSEATKNNARWIALWATLITFAISLVAWLEFDRCDSRLPTRRERTTGSATPFSTSSASTAFPCPSSC